MTTDISETLNENATTVIDRDVSNPVGTLEGASQMEGDFTVTDVEIPKINLVQAMSTELVTNGFKVGEFVLNRQAGLGEEFKFVVLNLKKTYQEDLDYDSDQMPRIFASVAEAETAGYTTKWNTGQPRVKPVIEALLLVEGDPKDASGQFSEVYKGKGYARALYTLASSSAYRMFGKVLATAGLIGHLKNDLAAGWWTGSSTEMSNGKNKWQAPKPTPAGEVDAKFREWITATFDV